MLAFITTDAVIGQETLQKALSEDVQDTYNMISVDGDTSTNDTVLLLANGLAGNPEIRYGTPEYETFAGALHAINEYLAKKIAGDGEGATALLEARVEGCENREQAKTLAKSIVCSNLTKTAIAAMTPTGAGSCVPWDIPVHSLIRKMWICSLKARQERYRSLKMERLFPTARQSCKDPLSAGSHCDRRCKDGRGRRRRLGLRPDARYIDINADYRS